MYAGDLCLLFFPWSFKEVRVICTWRVNKDITKAKGFSAFAYLVMGEETFKVLDC